MASGKSVFIICPGFIGWNVLDNLLAEGYAVPGLLQRDGHAKQIETSGATAIKGDLDDHDLITKETARHDVSGST